MKILLFAVILFLITALVSSCTVKEKAATANSEIGDLITFYCSEQNDNRQRLLFAIRQEVPNWQPVCKQII